MWKSVLRKGYMEGPVMEMMVHSFVFKSAVAETQARMLLKVRRRGFQVRRGRRRGAGGSRGVREWVAWWRPRGRR